MHKILEYKIILSKPEPEQTKLNLHRKQKERIVISHLKKQRR